MATDFITQIGTPECGSSDGDHDTEQTCAGMCGLRSSEKELLGPQSGGQGVREQGKLWPPPQPASPREGCRENAGMPLTFGIEVLGATTPLIPHAWGQGGKRKGEGAVEGGGVGGETGERKTR